MTDIVLMLLIAFTAGFFLGKFRGYRKGYVHASTEIPLLLRERSFLQGYCVLCRAGENMDANKCRSITENSDVPKLTPLSMHKYVRETGK